ncbi:DNA (Cytosine-5)-methyltransferase DRM1/2 isoform 2 [Hibiscus syriacus]|uniref:DNA (Cytosine-5)-methyltransferase DRM1/2 isoform 2 n=1 Tax=Hibiscus syriacus TaxID=106335 RepID=A0A6A2WRD1_HIBSY|nr:DNA (Cytosine-5)-methyltransferase DRM1/2 isoform 2 [Hibiscus syriacus]
MQHVDSDNYSYDYEAIFQDDFTDIDSSSDTEEILNSDSDEENKLLYLTKMGYSKAEASIAMERCGPNSSIAELTDFICAAQMAKAADTLLSAEDRKLLCNYLNYKKRRNSGYDFWKRKKQRKLEKKLLNEDNHAVHLPNLIIGSAKLTERIRKTLEAYDDEPPSSVQKYVLDEWRKWNLVWVGRNKVVSLEPDEVEMLLGSVMQRLHSTCLGIPLKTDAQELNGDRLEQLMSRFGKFDHVIGVIPSFFSVTPRYALPYLTLPEIWKVQQSSERHNGYIPDKENDRHGRGNNDVSRSEPVSRYNQSASDELFIPIIHLNGTYDSVIGESARDMD